MVHLQDASLGLLTVVTVLSSLLSSSFKNPWEFSVVLTEKQLNKQLYA